MLYMNLSSFLTKRKREADIDFYLKYVDLKLDEKQKANKLYCENFVHHISFTVDLPPEKYEVSNRHSPPTSLTKYRVSEHRAWRQAPCETESLAPGDVLSGFERILIGTIKGHHHCVRGGDYTRTSVKESTRRQIRSSVLSEQQHWKPCKCQENLVGPKNQFVNMELFCCNAETVHNYLVHYFVTCF